jgi:hypothetical protein
MICLLFATFLSIIWAKVAIFDKVMNYLVFFIVGVKVFCFSAIGVFVVCVFMLIDGKFSSQ